LRHRLGNSGALLGEAEVHDEDPWFRIGAHAASFA
jgi:hypothetical protein